VRCGRCGNDNAETNRFCGMCGALLSAHGQAAGQVTSPVAAGNAPSSRQPVASAPSSSRPAQQTAPVGLKSLDPISGERRATPLSPSQPAPEPVIAGPSFLGLNAPDRHRNSSAGRDPLQPSSGNLDYLLDDEDEPRGGGFKFILFLIALALAVGFGYLHWKQGGFDWVNAINKKPAVTKPAPDSREPASDSTGAAATQNPSTPPSATNPPVTPIPTDAAPTNPSSSAATNSTSSPTTLQPTPTQATPSQATSSQGAPSQAPPSPVASSPAASSQAGPAATPNNSAAGASDSTLRASAPESDHRSSDQQQSSEDEPAATEKPVTRKPATAKPSIAKPSASKPYDSVAEAERYIYGRGIRQDCDHGLHLLKPAAEQSNPKAMISLGALYSTGTCTPRDLPTAYRWFAMALHKQPDNQALQDDLQKLWSQMTPPERQLAIKLSQ
jgi:hypothetical protein